MTDHSAPFLKRARLAACIAAAGFFVVASAHAQNRRGDPPPPPPVAVADQQQDRIEELESQLRAATAQNEDLQHQLNDAQREITRLRGMVGELAGVNQSLSAGQPPADGSAGAPAPDSGDASPPPPQGAPLSGGGGGGATAGLSDAQVRATGTLGSLSERELPPGPPPPSPEDVYANARSMLVAGKLADAEEAFGDFINRYPGATNAADARFWLAYTQLARNNYQDAASNFVDYLQHNRTAARAPEAQVRLGMALAGLGQTQQACAAFADVARRYPHAAATVRNLATREAGAAHCAA